MALIREWWGEGVIRLRYSCSRPSFYCLLLLALRIDSSSLCRSRLFLC